MTWHLKDRELENKLIESCPNFLQELEDGVALSDKGYDWISVEFARESAFGELVDNRLFFWRDELEEVYEYNRNGWNDSRKVTPPEDVLLRAKIFKKNYAGGVWIDFECLIYKCTGWFKVRDFKPYGGRIVLDPGEFIEFRPWED